MAGSNIVADISLQRDLRCPRAVSGEKMRLRSEAASVLTPFAERRAVKQDLPRMQVWRTAIILSMQAENRIFPDPGYRCLRSSDGHVWIRVHEGHA